MIKKILLCLLLTWITCVLFLEVSIISKSLISNIDDLKSNEVKLLKIIGFYSL